jgi:murein DD-endopeptidase MepM/ murein hydrolase activator NlpD
VFRGFSRGFAQSLEQPGRELPEDRGDGSAGRADNNGRSVNGAHPARFGEGPGCKSPIAALQAPDVREPRCERLELGAGAEELGDGFGGHDGERRSCVNIILVSDSLAKSRSLALSQGQVLLIAFGILLAGFMLATATYVVTMKFAVDLRNPYLRALLSSLHQDEMKRNEVQVNQNLDALAAKVGELQARILRLDAFGERLAKAAGIKREEFRFDEKPGQGGPVLASGHDLTVAEFQQMLDDMSRVLDDRSDKLGVLDSFFMDDRLARKTIPTTMPVSGGYYSSNYGYRLDPISGHSEFHTGVDIVAPVGTQVMAAAGGVVSASTFMPEYGNVVDVDHDNGLTSRYAHLSKRLVKVGDVVMKGQLIALVGNTGRTTGPHLHFEVREKGIPLNPNKFLAIGKKDVLINASLQH